MGRVGVNVEAIEGIVVQRSSRNVRVRTGSGLLLCSLRGRFRELESGRQPVVGDRVHVREVGGGEGVLERTLPRRNEVRRAKAARGRKGGRRRGARAGDERRERVVAANVDQVLVILAARLPPPRWGIVDRVLVSSHYEGVDTAICLNKWDQVAQDSDASRPLEEALATYRSLGYTTFRTCLREGEGLDGVVRWLDGRSTVLSGHSGVGKSTLINAVCPGRDVATREVSDSTGRGRHMTVSVTLYELRGGGWLVDTPGYREYGLIDLSPSELGRHYVEFAPHVPDCRFKDCLHLREPGCAVLEARRRGEITEFRYDNYRRILATLAGSA